MVVKINGDIVGNDWKPVYDFFRLECCCPADIDAAIKDLPEGDKLEVKINSGGGEVFAGQEIYTKLLNRSDVDIEIESIAASAASVIAMAAPCSISPVGMIMIHNVSVGGASGDHNAMSKMADTLKQIDAAMANAYVQKTGKSLEDVLKLMEKETWLTAERAVELGFADKISDTSNIRMAAGIGQMAVTDEMVAEYKKAMKAKADKEELLSDLDDYGV